MQNIQKMFFFREIAFLAVLNFFPVQKNDFWPFLKLQKKDFGLKKFRRIDLFDSTSFFGLDFFKFTARVLLTIVLQIYRAIIIQFWAYVAAERGLFFENFIY